MQRKHSKDFGRVYECIKFLQNLVSYMRPSLCARVVLFWSNYDFKALVSLSVVFNQSL